MNAVKLAGLEPACVFAQFEKLCEIPHGSGNTKKISDYLVSFAKEHGLRYIQDGMNNVIIFQEGTEGYEDHEPVILQGHMDMVCEKDADCPINFETDGLDITYNDTFVYANGTTLGGDDGIALAYCLALMDDPEIPHPPLEVIFTVDEETGLYGATDIDVSMLKGKRLINLDSEDEGIFTVSCAGGATATLALPVSRHPVYGPCIKLTVDGLIGGHSGGEIHKNRANANVVMGMFLDEIKKIMPLCLTGIAGGTKDNAITRSCTATFVAMGLNVEQINDIAQTLQEKIRTEYEEPDAVVTADNVEALGGNALSTQDTDRIIGLLCAVPNGVQAMSEKIPGMVQTSLNMGIVKLEGNTFRSQHSVRSSVEAEKTELLGKLSDLAKLYSGECTVSGMYDAWELRPQSDLCDTLVAEFDKMFGHKPQVVSIHAGLECGLFCKKIPGLDAISMGPQLYDVHTSRERMDIASTARTWEFLKACLKAL